MIEAFFKKKSRIAKIKYGPLGEYADGLAETLGKNSYSPSMIQGILVCFGELNYYLHSRNIAPGTVTTAQLDAFLEERNLLVNIKGNDNFLRHIVRYLVEIKAIPPTCRVCIG